MNAFSAVLAGLAFAGLLVLIFLGGRRPVPVSLGGYSGGLPASEVGPPTPSRFQPPTGLTRQTTHDCQPPTPLLSGTYRFRCPVCHSDFEKPPGTSWFLVQRRGVQWVSVDDPNTGDKPRTTLICNRADHHHNADHPYRSDCGPGRPS